MPRTFGLIDGNSFYCSCERAFSPRLRGRAVVVLSNNDGCAVARTSEAKAVVKMGDPWHLARRRPEVRAAQVVWLSSNYSLYGDMSRRMYQVLAARVARVEPYSIDEMFLDMDTPKDAADLARELRDAVRRIAKIPTCVGIGPTKTIALYGVALSTHFIQYLPACIHEFLTHGSDWTDCGGAVSPVTFRDRRRSPFSTSRWHIPHRVANAGAGLIRPASCP